MQLQMPFLFAAAAGRLLPWALPQGNDSLLQHFSMEHPQSLRTVIWLNVDVES